MPYAGSGLIWRRKGEYMDFKREESGKRGVLCLDGELTIQRAAELKVILLTSLGDVEDLVLDWAGVTGLDVSGLQLLCAAYRTAAKANKRLTSTGSPPDVFTQTIRDAGFAGEQICSLDHDQSCLWRTDASWAK